MIPCKGCILFALCNSQTNWITCSLLYNYFIEGGVKLKKCHGGEYYTSPQTDRLKEIPSFFKRKMSNYTLNVQDPFYDGATPAMTFFWDTSPGRMPGHWEGRLWVLED